MTLTIDLTKPLPDEIILKAAKEIEYISVRDAGAMLGLSYRQTANLCAKGMLGKKFGEKNWLITRQEVEQLRKDGRPGVGRPRKPLPGEEL